MISDKQKILEVELALDGIKLGECYGKKIQNLQHNEWSGELFEGYSTKNLYKACRNHLRWFRKHPEIFTEVKTE